MSAAVPSGPVPSASVRSAPRAPSTGTPHRSTPVDRLLDGLDALVARHRALVSQAPAEQTLHTELIGVEIAHELELARANLRRPPRLSIVETPGP